MVLFQVVVGLLFLVSGRRLFWLFVACLGAVTGMMIVEPIMGNVDWPVIVLVIGMAGVCGAMLAVFFQKGAIGLSGFLAGGYLAVAFPSSLGAAPPHSLWLIYMIGGLVGLVVALMFFEWALIVLSSLSGASLIIQTVGLPSFEAMAVLLVLAVAGTILQTRQLLVEA